MFFNIWCLSLLLLINSQKSDLLISAQEIDKDVEIITGKDMPQPPSMKFGLGRSYYVGDYYGPQIQQAPEPTWKASAKLLADGAAESTGEVSFRQTSPFNAVLVNINATGMPPGKHAVHIHAYGDMKEGCKSTGPHVKNVLIGNIEVPESGTIDLTFYSSYVNLFGPRAVIGRSIVIHEKPIEFNRAPDLYGVPVAPQANPVSFQTEELAVGNMVACGIITITENVAT